jgi:hypothetical protein
MASALGRGRQEPGSRSRRTNSPSDNLESQRPEYAENHALAIEEDIIVPHSENLQPRDRFEIILAPPVFQTAIVMAAAIELDDQSVGTAIEIHDIGTDGVLASESHATQAAITEQSPEDALRECRVAM